MIGIFSKTTDSNLVEAISVSGLDFMIFDQEHGPVDLSTLHNHVRAAQLGGMKSIIRVKENNHNFIGSALDAGVDGVQIPNIGGYDEARMAIEAAKFYPQGQRGLCRFVKAAKFGTEDKQDYFVSANKKLVILQIEGKKGIEAIDEILSLDGFDILFIGPYDLSQSLGFPGEIDHPVVQEAIENLVVKTKSRNIKLGTFVDEKTKIKTMKEKGFKYIAYSVDLNLFSNCCRDIKLLYNG